MLQIVIWGMAIMLVVKGLDVLHQDAIAKKTGHAAYGSAILTCLVAFGGAIVLVVLANEQVKQTPAMPAMPSFGNP